LLARFGDLVNSNICITKIYWTKCNFPSKANSKSNEDKNQDSLASCEGWSNSATLYLYTYIYKYHMFNKIKLFVTLFFFNYFLKLFEELITDGVARLSRETGASRHNANPIEGIEFVH